SVELPPGERVKNTARLNGLLGGIAADESFNLSQSYFYGCVSRTHHRGKVTEGRCIDQGDELDAIAVGGSLKQRASARLRGDDRGARPCQADDNSFAARLGLLDDYYLYRSQIGTKEFGFNAPIKAAAGVWLRVNGSQADTVWLRADLEKAINDA